MKSLVWIKEKAPLGDIAPSPREGHTLTYIPEIKSLLMFGGLHNNIRMNDIYLYDIEKNIWKLQTTTGRQPSFRSFHSAFYEEPYFFVYGGQGENGKSLGDLNFLNVNTWEWKLLFVLEAPPSRHFTTVCDMENQEREKIIFGGVSSPDNKLYNDLWIMSYSSVTFNSVLPKIPGTVFTLKKGKGEVPAPRRGHCATVHNKSLIVYGGETTDPEDANWIFQLPFETWTWKKIPGLGKPLNARSFASYCLFDKNNLLMFGGIENQTDKFLNDINILNLNDFKWASPFVGGHPPTPRYNHASCGYELGHEGKGMVIIGGLEAGYCNMGLFKLTEKEAKDYTKDYAKEYTEIKKTKDFTAIERREVNTFESITVDQKNQIQDIERAITKEKKYTSDLEKEIAMLEQELKHIQGDQNMPIQKLEEQIATLDEEYLVNYQHTKQLFSLIPIEQFIMAEGNIKNSMLEEVVQKTESYLIALDKLYIAISKYKIDASDDQEIRLRDLYESVQGDVLKLREMHKNSLHFLKNVYDEHAHLVGKVEAEINMQRERILEIDRKYKEILVQSEVEDL